MGEDKTHAKDCCHYVALSFVCVICIYPWPIVPWLCLCPPCIFFSPFHPEHIFLCLTSQCLQHCASCLVGCCGWCDRRPHQPQQPTRYSGKQYERSGRCPVLTCRD